MQVSLENETQQLRAILEEERGLLSRAKQRHDQRRSDVEGMLVGERQEGERLALRVAELEGVLRGKNTTIETIMLENNALQLRCEHWEGRLRDMEAKMAEAERSHQEQLDQLYFVFTQRQMNVTR